MKQRIFGKSDIHILEVLVQTNSQNDLIIGVNCMYRLYTHNDLDGVSCGILAKLAFGENVEIRYNSVSGLDFQISRFLERDKKEDCVFITDLSVNEKNEKGLETYYKKGGKLHLIDHHKTALHFNEYDWGKVIVEHEDGRLASATNLFYEHLIENGLLKPSKVVESYVELVRQYDTWEWDKINNIKAKKLNDLFFLFSIDDFEERMVERLTSREDFNFDDFEVKILDIEEEKIQRYVRRKKREIVQTFINEKCVGIVHAESYHSELGNELGKENPHLDYIAIINVGGKRISLRTTKEDIDVSEIAGQYGGGGHAKASGCSLTEEAYQYFVAEPFQIEPMRADAFRNRYNLKESLHGTLYENRHEDQFFVFQSEDRKWMIDWNGEYVPENFLTFQEAENYVKRNYSAWLVRDERFIEFLMEHVMEMHLLPQNSVESEDIIHFDLSDSLKEHHIEHH